MCGQIGLIRDNRLDGLRIFEQQIGPGNLVSLIVCQAKVKIDSTPAALSGAAAFHPEGVNVGSFLEKTAGSRAQGKESLFLFPKHFRLRSPWKGDLTTRGKDKC